jgi:hypothetical protein
MAGWNTPIDWNTISVVGPSDLNTHIRDNENFLLSGKALQSAVVANPTFATTSTTYTDVGAPFSVTFTSTTGRALILTPVFYLYSDNTAGTAQWTVLLDGVDIGDATVGFGQSAQNSSKWVSLALPLTGLSAGSHTVKLQYKVSVGTHTCQIGTGGFLGATVQGREYMIAIEL